MTCDIFKHDYSTSILEEFHEKLDDGDLEESVRSGLADRVISTFREQPELRSMFMEQNGHIKLLNLLGINLFQVNNQC